MPELVTLCLFAGILLTCILSGWSVLYALILGYLLFCGYGLLKKHSVFELLQMSVKGIRTVRNILFIFLLIGMITAAWRASGTIPFLIYYSSKLIVPSAFLLIAFLLNCMVSVLTGTAFGTAATIGVVCMMMANTMAINPVYAGGAILSGIYFGDRCSPMSTSALLVCELTKTDIFRNIRRMVQTSAVPFLFTCGIYLLLGLSAESSEFSPEILNLFLNHFRLSWIVLLPAVLIIVLSLFKIKVKYTMAVSILTACVICLTLQNADPGSLVRWMVVGYRSSDPRLAAMMDGGGIVSMVKVAAIICISSSYTGLFDGTGLLNGVKGRIRALSRRITPYGSTLCTSVLASMVACNQTLTIMLTYQLCRDTVPDREKMAIDLENTAVVIAPLVPWSIAGATPLATVNAPAACIAAAVYLYLLPIWNLICQKRKNS